MSPEGEITRLLSDIQHGDQRAASKLMDFVYAELRRLAASYMRRERREHTLQPTALVHEAYLRLLGDQEMSWRNRAHFYGVAANMMRRVLVDHARGRNAQKRGGLLTKIECDDDISDSSNAEIVGIIDLDNALQRLETLDARLSRVVELRYFGGLTVEETSEVMGISPKTVKRDWAIARGWLKSEIGGGSSRAAGRMDQG